MEEKQPTAISNGLMYGLITGVILIFFGLILFLTDLYLNKYVSWISYLLLTAGMIYGTLEFRKKQPNGFISYGKSFSSCFWIGLFAGILTSIYMFVFAKFIHPGLQQEMLEQVRTNMAANQASMTEEQMDQAMAMTAKFMSPGMMAFFSVLMYSFASAVIALILAIFLKKEDPALKITN